MNWDTNTIMFDSLPAEKWATCEWRDLPEVLREKPLIEYLIVWHHKTELGGLENLPSLPGLKYLELNWSNARDLRGIENLASLKRLELHYCVKLESDTGVDAAKEHLEFIHINQAKKFVCDGALASLRELRVLRLNSCGPISSLEFVLGYPTLEDFRFVGTNIVDGKLLPLMNHPSLKSVGMSNKRHYSHKDRTIQEALSRKRR